MRIPPAEASGTRIAASNGLIAVIRNSESPELTIRWIRAERAVIHPGKWCGDVSQIEIAFGLPQIQDCLAIFALDPFGVGLGDDARHLQCPLPLDCLLGAGELFPRLRQRNLLVRGLQLRQQLPGSNPATEIGQNGLDHARGSGENRRIVLHVELRWQSERDLKRYRVHRDDIRRLRGE